MEEADEGFSRAHLPLLLPSQPLQPTFQPPTSPPPTSALDLSVFSFDGDRPFPRRRSVDVTFGCRIFVESVDATCRGLLQDRVRRLLVLSPDHQRHYREESAGKSSNVISTECSSLDLSSEQRRKGGKEGPLSSTVLDATPLASLYQLLSISS